MTKKVLNTEAITNELQGASLFFTRPASEKEEIVPVITSPTSPPDNPEELKKDSAIKNRTEQKKDIKLASKQASIHASTNDNLIEAVRKTVKQIGKDAVFLRLTPAEKRELASIVYSLNEIYGDEIKKTTENQIGRIGLNYLLADYKDRGDNSILASVLKALNA